MCDNITSLDQVGASLKFLELAKETSFKLVLFLSAKIYNQEKRLGLKKPLFPQQEKQTGAACAVKESA